MHDLVRWRSHKVYLPVNVNLNTSVIKPMHSQWTLESHAFSATQNRWMENAWRDTGLLPILDGTFVPNPELSTMYVPPSIATAELAEQCDPPSDEESYSTSFSEAEQISDIDDEGKREFTWKHFWIKRRMSIVMQQLLLTRNLVVGLRISHRSVVDKHKKHCNIKQEARRV